MRETTAQQTTLDEQAAPDYSKVLIKCVELTKTFRDFWMRPRVRAVDGIDLEVRRGEVFGLLGPNGSGKSTTIKMILGLLQPSAGRIAVFGSRPDNVANKARIGYLPEESYLYRFLNARETLDYYGRLFHQNSAKRKARIDMLLEMVGLTAVQRRPVGEFSKGMQRRIGLAQALINDPELLILDEPTTGLDPIGTRQIKDLIIQLARRGKTIVLCSHLLGDVEDVCDRVSIMFGGKVRAEGTVDDLLTRRDATTIRTAAMDEQTRQQIRDLLESRGVRVDEFDQPRQRLEDLFLDIVHQAQRQGVATSGAKAGGRIAQFLTDDDVETRAAHLPEDADAARLLDSLMTGDAPPQQAGASAPAASSAGPTKPDQGGRPDKPSTAAKASEPQPDDRLLEQLTEGDPRESAKVSGSGASARSSPPAEGRQEEEAADRSVIDSLLDEPDKRSSSS